MDALIGPAPGRPGLEPRWTSSAKSGAGTAVDSGSRVWFTISHGIVNEVYYPDVDQANVRDLGFLISDGSDFFSEEKRDARSKTSPLAPGVPGYKLANTCNQGRYRIHKVVVTDPCRDVLLQQVRFEALRRSIRNYRLYALLAPHVGNQGYDNDGWVGEHEGETILFARRNDTTLALACSVPFLKASCGYVGFSDGWQDISAHKRMTWGYSSAEGGNVALTAEIDLAARTGTFLLALAFGSNPDEAAENARAALLDDFDQTVRDYVAGWRDFQSRCLDLRSVAGSSYFYRVSTSVLKTHISKRFPGGIIASLSVPWGSSKGDDDLGGYHLVWPRDLVEAAGGLLAAGDADGARRALVYLLSTQDPDGHWPQNMWLDGKPFWRGVQMDETALPILLADSLRRADELAELHPWPMVRKAVAFIVCNGPVTQQDRWEEDGGFSPFTLAAEIAALLAAADFADAAGEASVAHYLRQTADAWNASVERWTYVTGGQLAEKVGVGGYFVRVAPPDVADTSNPAEGFVPIKNRPPGEASEPCVQIVSPDALALVRFGLRSPDDPRIVDTVKVIDATLKVKTATGPTWHRYTGDGYGEHADGSPFDGRGVGRGWPLLVGERGHYELARGNRAEARRLLKVMQRQASPTGLFPEQVWDAPYIAEKHLLSGHATGSAMPLVWAHAEYVKLLRSIKDKLVFDTPPQTVRRYQVEAVSSNLTIWRFNLKCRSMPVGRFLRIELLAVATVHWTSDSWRTVHDVSTADSGLGVHFTDLPVANLSSGSSILFTFRWISDGRWEGQDFEVVIEA